jgi:predicted N-acetyltransferase YhbS
MVHIRPATSSDISSIADLQAAAFADDELFTWLYPRRKDYPCTFRHDWLHRLRQRTNAASQKIFVAESGGDVVGVAIWDWKGKKADEAGWTDDNSAKSKTGGHTIMKHVD